MQWFVDGVIRKKLYEGEETVFPHRTIVIADDYDQAYEKYTNYWEKKTDEYCVYYSVESYNINETIM